MSGEIARGGMGAIHLGKDATFERDVAVKISTVPGEEADYRFFKEAKILASLAHPNIVPVHAMGTDAEGRPFYSMKLIRGRTLQSILDAIREGNASVAQDFPEARLLEIFRKICDAMSFAHSRGILHRDLKPENVMVGEYGEVLVMDWGLAKEMGLSETPSGSRNSPIPNSASAVGATMEGEVMGTPQYMSPEQAEGALARMDERSDIYSLGGVLFAILTGHAPIEGATVDAVLDRVKRGVLREAKTSLKTSVRSGHSLTKAPSDVPDALVKVVHKAMALRREDRYAQVSDLSSEVDAYLHGFATRAEAAGLWRRTWLWVRRNRAISGAVLIGLSVAAALTGKVLREGRRATLALAQLNEQVPALFQLGVTMAERGKFEDALSQMDTVLTIDPNFQQAQFRRGFLLLALGKNREFLEWTLLASKTEWVPWEVLAAAKAFLDYPDSSDAVRHLNYLVQYMARAGLVTESTTVKMQGSLSAQELVNAIRSRIKASGTKGIGTGITPDGIVEVHVGEGASDLSCLSNITIPLLRIGMSAPFKSLDFTRDLSFESIESHLIANLSIDPLKNKKLKRAAFYKSNILSLAPLKGMPLEELIVGKVGDGTLDALRGMPTKRLRVEGGPYDLSPLQGAPLEELDVQGKNYSMISKQHLKRLSIGWRGIGKDPANIDAIKFLSPETLIIGDIWGSLTLSKIVGKTVRSLSLGSLAAVHDLEFLLECTQLEELKLGKTKFSLEPIRNHPSLKRILHGLPDWPEPITLSAEEYWRNWDAKKAESKAKAP
jgi:serine/threonine protein kinase